MSNPLEEMQKVADACAERGKQLAMQLMEPLLGHDARVSAHALAIMFAALLVAHDGETVIHEQLGLGLIGDEERLTLHCEEVREWSKRMRDKRTGPDRGVM